MVLRKDEPPEVRGQAAEAPRMTRAEAARQHIEDPAAYESTDTPTKGVFIFIGGLLASVGLTLIVLLWLYGFLASRSGPFPAVKQAPPEPRLQPDPQQELKAYEAQQEAILNSYGWVDKNAGIVRIPIARAIDLLAQRGLPARTGAGPIPTAPDTGAASGGPQTGPPAPRGKIPPNVEQSVPMRGIADTR